jgi:hypothetical protein
VQKCEGKWLSYVCGMCVTDFREQRHVDLRRRALQSKGHEPVVDQKAFGNNMQMKDTTSYYDIQNKQLWAADKS